MRRLMFSLLAVLAGMVVLITLVMTLVPDTDTLTTKRYQSENGYQFDYPRGWQKLAISGDERELSQMYIESGYLPDCAFAPGLFSSKSLCVYISESETTMESMQYFTEWLKEAYEQAGYQIDSIGAHSRFGEHWYYTIRCRANGRDMREYIIFNGARMFSFVFSGCSDTDVSGVLSSVSFFHDAPSEAV